jgi:5-methylcytosine-specific restriction protein A
MSRSVPEWIGKTPNTSVPPRVRARVFVAHGGVCHLSGRRVRPGDAWECDHVIALVNGGENRESNLAPALRDKHREKTAADVAEKSKVERIRKKHLGIWPQAARKIQSRGFEKRGAR